MRRLYTGRGITHHCEEGQKHMKIQYRNQKFQADAAKAVVDVFAGQPYRTVSYQMDRGSGNYQIGISEERDFTGFCNQKIVPELSDRQILEQLNRVQRAGQIKPSEKLEGRESGYHLTVEMETGVGKTYTYIKTIFELNRHYGWSKFIVVVPSVAVREGVYKSFEMTREHFAEEYGKKIRFFIYNSAQLTEIDRFASDRSIHVMIINAQAFNARGKDARRIYMKLDEFRSRRPVDIIAGTNPILIIDEPQSVEGRQTKERLKEFHPLLTLRYSATHKADSIYNMVYRLDAVEAYNRRLVKKIAVKGITEAGSTASDGYLYLECINLSRRAPTATLQFEVRTAGGTLRKKSRIVRIGDNLYDYSGGLEEYRDGYVVRQIDGRDDSVEFLNGIRIFAGDVIGAADEDQIRRIQIRETILSHLQRERCLFHKGIKVLSLFFIDEVANYREYDGAGGPVNGKYAAMFEEEYADVTGSMESSAPEDEYIRYLRAIPPAKTHAGYFSVDGKGRMVNSKVGRKETTSDDVSAYELIMKHKELLLDRDPVRSPVRFIFSHSALREGWDNPNVFQICTLKQSGSDVRRRQEVGRGLRLCVDQNGERMDAGALGDEVHQVNVLTVIASESYDSFARGLQTEMAETAVDWPQPENARSSNVELQVDEGRLNSREFRELWSRIRTKSAYTVDFDTDELVQKAVASLNSRLHVARMQVQVETGVMESIRSKEELAAGASFVKESSRSCRMSGRPDSGIRYDLIGKLVDETKLTRRAVSAVLQGIQPAVFDLFKENPEEFIARAAALINEEKAAAVMEHITYEALDDHYDMDIFTAPSVRGRLGINAAKARKHLYDHIVYESNQERVFAAELDANENVAVYVKLPKSFYIPTPAGHYTPDWAIAFYEGTVRHVYFVAETKGSESSMQLRRIEEAKIRCAREHFKAISGEGVVYDVAESCSSLMEKAMRGTFERKL